MKLKVSWPTAIVVSIAAFVIFILSFVFKVMFLPEYDHHLVSEDYYKDELNYQQEIDNENKGIALSQNVKLEKKENGINIVFPPEFENSSITGTVFFQRLSNNKIDFTIPIELKENALFVSDDILVEGRWDVKINWTVNNETYLYKEKIIY